MSAVAITPETITEESPFLALGVTEAVARAIAALGFQQPTPIQAGIIPSMIEGRDVVGVAQTGTGKTAAFALPLLSKIPPQEKGIQALILTPTRELALQVAKAFSEYARHGQRRGVAAVYGGAGYADQLRALREGAQIVVGTPGRVMDHMRSGALRLDKLKTLVLDEADEMLRMGFIDDVRWILDQAPSERQIALFSATMPREIRSIAESYLVDPFEVAIRSESRTATSVDQHCIMLSQNQKYAALRRVLEASDAGGAVMIFTRTKEGSNQLADSLMRDGFTAAAINGDLNQAQRERAIAQLKSGAIDIMVATDVAARGIDIERINTVINYDAPLGTESYIHRIGRTGRAGRTGTAITFFEPRERKLRIIIERTARQQIKDMAVPNAEMVNRARVERLAARALRAVESSRTEEAKSVLAQITEILSFDSDTIAAALLVLLNGERRFFVDASTDIQASTDNYFESKRRERGPRQFSGRAPRERSSERSFEGRAPAQASGRGREKAAREGGPDSRAKRSEERSSRPRDHGARQQRPRQESSRQRPSGRRGGPRRQPSF
jgi:ATP-dependent RNA helicase DeaD